jgi:hypothetical protein
LRQIAAEYDEVDSAETWVDGAPVPEIVEQRIADHFPVKRLALLVPVGQM